MNKQTEALKLALEALELYMRVEDIPWSQTEDAITAIREALAHAPTVREQPSRMKRLPKGHKAQIMGTRMFQTMYTADQMRKFLQPSKPWIGLSEQERNDLEDYCEMIIGKAAFEAIEAKLKEKNT